MAGLLYDLSKWKPAPVLPIPPEQRRTLEAKWFSKHPHLHLHFTPTSSSWLNMIERWFGELARKRIRRETFASVADLIKAIKEYIRLHAKISHCKPVIETLN